MHHTVVQPVRNAGSCAHVLFLKQCVFYLSWPSHSCRNAIWMCTGGIPFVYQSCTHQQQPRGSMEGFFKFVEGTVRQPTGPAFDVEASVVLSA